MTETTTAEFARSVASSYNEIHGFDATQSIEAGPIEIKCRVRFRKPEKVSVEYEVYRNPLNELDEILSNGAELTHDELAGMTLFYDGRATWLVDPKTQTAVLRPSRVLFEPLPGLDAIGEIGFLDGFVQDYLVRDEDSETLFGRKARVLRVKPKSPHRSCLLKTISFPFRNATVAFDPDTRFPHKISFFPARGTALHSLVGPNEQVTITYSDVRVDDEKSASIDFSPTEDVRCFRETFVPRAELGERVPFPFALDPLFSANLRPLGDGGTLTIDDEGRRAYCVLHFVPEEAEQEAPRLLTLRAGNYLSRNMSRRRATIAEKGELVRIGNHETKLLDRRLLWAEHLPQVDPRLALELMWEHEGVFWFLAAEGVERDQLVTWATLLLSDTPDSDEEMQSPA